VETHRDGYKERYPMPRSVAFVGHAALAFILGFGSSREALWADDGRFTTDVFTSGAGGYHTYRIPALLVTPKGALLAFCEGRKTSPSDAGDIDLLLRRSGDGGRTWGPTTLVHEEGGTNPITIGNPCAVVDATTGIIWLAFCRNNDDVLMTSSQDDGRTWAIPRTITGSVKEPGWTWYATGPGIGIQITRGPHAGRLVIPCDHRESVDGKPVMFSHVFFSDDHGRTWTLGGTVERHTDECQVVELATGELLINMRNYWGRDGGRPDRGGRRAIARSRDGGATWSLLEFEAALIEPVCQASLIAIPRPVRPTEALLVFSNPASTTARRTLTVRVSGDDGKTWPVTIPVDAGPSAYSCLAPLADGRVGLLYERGKSARITFTIVPIPWPE
jgi:sialidase-1